MDCGPSSPPLAPVMMGPGTRPSRSAAACWRSISTSCSSRARGERAGEVSSRPPSVTLGITEGSPPEGGGPLWPEGPLPGGGRHERGSKISSASAMRGWGEGARPLADTRRAWLASPDCRWGGAVGGRLGGR
jgi:hypothetical protein